MHPYGLCIFSIIKTYLEYIKKYALVDQQGFCIPEGDLNILSINWNIKQIMIRKTV